MRILIDNKGNQDANNVYLPQTSADEGVIATGGGIKVDTLTTYTSAKGKAVFDLSQLNYTGGYTVYSVGLVKTSGTPQTIFNGATSGTDNNWINANEAVISLIAQFETVLNALFPQYTLVQDGDNLVIETNNNTRDENGVEFTLYINNGVERTYSGIDQNAGQSITGALFQFDINGDTYAIDADYTTQNIDVILESIAQALNGESVSSSDFTVNNVTTLSSSLVATATSNSVIIYSTGDAVTALTANFTSDFPLLSPETNTIKVEDVQTITGGEDRSTTAIDFKSGTTSLVSLTPSGSDFDSTTTELELMSLVRDELNEQADFTSDGVKLVADETITIYNNTVGGDGDNLSLVFNGQTVTFVDTSADKLTMLQELNTAIGSNFTALTSEVDQTGSVPVLKITADGTKDLGNGIFKITSSISQFSTTASGDPKTDFPFDAKLILRTTQSVDTYNDLTLSFAVTGDGTITTSAMTPLTGGGTNALTPMLRALTKGRGCVFEGVGETPAGLNMAGFGGFIMVGEEPVEILTQSDIFSLEPNHLIVDEANGLGWSVTINRIEENNKFYVATFPLAPEFYIENDEEKVFGIEVERVGSTCNFYFVRFDNPIKTETGGWNVLYRNQLGSLPYSAGNTYRFLYLNNNSDEAFIYNISNGVYVINKLIIDANEEFPLTVQNTVTRYTIKNLLSGNKWTLPHILANDGVQAKLTMIRAEGN